LNEPRHPQTAEGVASHLTRRLVSFLFLLYIVAYLDRLNVGFAILGMRKQFGFSETVFGTAGGMFFLGYLIFQVPSNLILARVGARRWICALMILWGAVSASMIFVRSPASFYALRFLLGAAEAGFFPGVILYLKGWFPAEARARAVAWFMTAAPLSGVVGGPIAGLLLKYHPGSLAGWQWLFLMEGLPAMALGGVVFFFLSDAPARAHWLAAEERAWLLDTLERERSAVRPASRTNFFAAMASANVWVFVCVYFGLNISSYGTTLWLPSILESVSGRSELGIGLLSAIPYLAAAVVMVFSGRHSDRTGERRWHVALAAFVGAAAFLAAAYGTSAAPLLAAMSVATMAIYAMVGPFWAMPSTLLGGSAAAAGIALINALGNLGGYVGPYGIAWLKKETGSFRAGFFLAAGAMAMSGVAALLLRMEERPRGR